MSKINNEFRLTGHVGADPETRYLPTKGNPIVNFPLAVDSSYKDKTSGDKVENTDWFDMTVYAEGLVKVVQDYVRKGSQIQVRGRLQKRVWESKDRKDGEGRPLKESRITFIMTEVMLLGRPKDSANAPEAGSTYTAPDTDHLDDDIPF